MKIETKFNIGDTVYYNHMHKIIKAKIVESTIVKNGKECYISYYLEENKNGKKRYVTSKEEDIFSNKKDALKSIICSTIKLFDTKDKELLLTFKRELDNYLK